MHRSELLIQFSRLSPVSRRTFVGSALFTTPQETTQALFGPLHYEPGYAYPLIVWLHSPGTDERQLLRIMPFVDIRNYVAVAPRGARVRSGKGSHAERYGWPQTAQGIQLAEQRVFDGIDVAAQKYHIASKSIYLAGFGSAGTMAFRIAFSHPGRFAGVLSFCGALPRGGNPLSRIDDARRLPLMLGFGRRSRVYSPARGCADLRLLYTAGFPVIDVRDYPYGQELTAQMLGDMNRWIMKRIETSRAAVARGSSSY